MRNETYIYVTDTYMQVEIAGFSENEHSVVFCVYENEIFLPPCEVHLKSFLHRVLRTVLEYSVSIEL